jgi:hypothetical protein
MFLCLSLAKRSTHEQLFSSEKSKQSTYVRGFMMTTALLRLQVQFLLLQQLTSKKESGQKMVHTPKKESGQKLVDTPKKESGLKMVDTPKHGHPAEIPPPLPSPFLPRNTYTHKAATQKWSSLLGREIQSCRPS